MRPRITFVVPSLQGGGAERVALSLLASLDTDRYDPTVLIFDDSGPFSDLVPAHVAVHVIGHRRLRKAFPGMFMALRRIRPQVIFSTLGYANLAVLAMRPFLHGRPRVLIRESNTPSRSLPTLANANLLRLGYRLLYRHADKVICQSQLMGAELVNDFGVRPDRIAHLANPVDVGAIRGDAAPPPPPTRLEGVGPRFVAAGQLVYQKGFDRLLDLMASASSDSHLTILGSGAEVGSLAEQGRALGIGDRVHFGGFSPCPWPTFAGADAFLLPSRWEGMANVALEALACGTPVIGTPEAGGLAEVAAAAPPGAVTLASFDAGFLRAMGDVLPRHDVTLRPSLLPASFEVKTVAATFAQFVAT